MGCSGLVHDLCFQEQVFDVPPAGSYCRLTACKKTTAEASVPNAGVDAWAVVQLAGSQDAVKAGGWSIKALTTLLETKVVDKSTAALALVRSTCNFWVGTSALDDTRRHAKLRSRKSGCGSI